MPRLFAPPPPPPPTETKWTDMASDRTNKQPDRNAAVTLSLEVKFSMLLNSLTHSYVDLSHFAHADNSNPKYLGQSI